MEMSVGAALCRGRSSRTAGYEAGWVPKLDLEGSPGPRRDWNPGRPATLLSCVVKDE